MPTPGHVELSVPKEAFGEIQRAMLNAGRERDLRQEDGQLIIHMRGIRLVRMAEITGL